MKKLTIIAAVLVMASTAVAAERGYTSQRGRHSSPKSFSRNYGMAGCGFGSQVMGKDGSQILASTTNGTFASNLFGITSGTSNCVDSATEEVAHRMDRFVQINQLALASDMAKGNGEALVALGSIAGCADMDTFQGAMQKSFRDIYTSEKVQIMEVTDSVISVIKSDSNLKSTCSKIL